MLEKDAENWMYYKTIGSKLKIKPGILPHKFIDSPPKIDLRSDSTESERKKKLKTLHACSRPLPFKRESLDCEGIETHSS
ncbi:hypothetical protein JTB14_006570 [Gonioctena quinquepunctata]|nr:hypothetical protein JTB14_006570 [Gonioctena quinquepunctata]